MRLAYEQGLLRQKNLNYFQHWALLYWIYLTRRVQLEDMRAELIQQTFNLFPERWGELYRAEVFNELGIADESQAIPVTEDDLDEVNDFLARFESKQWMHAAELGLPPDWTPDTRGTRV